MSAYNFVRSDGPNFTKDRTRQRRLDFVAIFIACRKSHRFMHVFCPPKF